MSDESRIQTIGRRKQAVARLVLTNGTGIIKANGRKFEDYFPSAVHRMLITGPLRVTDSEESYDINILLDGGGPSGQAGAAQLAIARALLEIDEEARGDLRAGGFLTRDPRKKESKKYGLKKARKAPQYSKR